MMMEKPLYHAPTTATVTTPIRKGVDVSQNTTPWDSLGDLCLDVWNCINSSGVGNKRLIVQFSLPGTQICVDVRNVKAAGVLCVLGISFGIGTYVLYKIYDKYIRPSVRRKPPKEGQEDDLWEQEEMGNNQSSLADVPVYYKAGCGVSLYNPLEENGKLRNRSSNQCIHSNKSIHSNRSINVSDPDYILKGNLKNKNGLVGSAEAKLDEERLNQLNSGIDRFSDVPGVPIRNHAPDLSQLRIEIDESGFVEDDNADFNANGDRLSNSLKGNFSPSSLCEKNFRLENEDGVNSVNTDSAKNGPTDLRTDLRTDLKPESNFGASSVLLTPPSEDDSSAMVTASERNQSQSAKSGSSDARHKIADQPETDEEYEQFSPLPLDKSPHRSPKRLCPQKLKLKLTEIAAINANLARSNQSSYSTSPDSQSISGKRTDSVSGEPDNSISGISSPELELLNSETTENPIVYASTFNNLEDEIHGVEDEFESISRELQALSNKYSTVDIDPASEIFQEIFQRYPSIRVRQTERGFHTSPLDPEFSVNLSSRPQSEAGEGSIDLSWDLESVLDMVYSEGSEGQIGSRESTPGSVHGHSLNLSALNGSINCEVELDGSFYEDELHLHLGTRPLPRIEETLIESSEERARDPVKMVPSDSAFSMNPSTSEDISVLSSGAVSSPVVSSPDTEMVDARSVVSEASETSSSNNGSEKLESCPVSIGERIAITDYVEEEWKGHTQKATLLRQAYRAIPDHCQCCHLRRIRGDNYCGIRGSVFQTLVNHLPPLSMWASKDYVLQQLNLAYQNKASGIRKWNFAHRIPYTKETKLEVMQQCVSSLYAKREDLAQHSSISERESFLVNLMNSDPDLDLHLMEGVKLLMALSASQLYSDMEQGKDVPVFAWLLFARDTSQNVLSFVRNHLNCVGSSGGLEQVEMCLLGYSLGVRIRVLRLHQFNDDDFVSYYPEDGTESWKVISLIAEDDRHYNVPVL